MINFVVRSFLGQGGSALLDYYLQNSLVINGIILLYLVILVLSRRTYATTLNFLVKSICDQPVVAGKEAKQIRSLLKKVEIPWDAALKSSYFPLISRANGWIAYPKTKSQIMSIFSPDIIGDEIGKSFEGKEKINTEGN